MKMKKYLITGALALVACATLTSCHSDDELSGSLVEQKLKAYEQVFEEEFGKVDPNQDWGFGTAELLARTRTAMARTRTAYTNANMWAEDWIVPQELTEQQKLRVTRYFQTHYNPGSTPNYGTKNYFVQQVYDGATDPITNYDAYKGNNPETGKPYSTEVYKAADGGNIDSGKHMDHLVVGTSQNRSNDHINNFNNATYGTNGEPNHEVQNSEGIKYYSTGSADGYHSDQIQLMLNHETYPWGYANSDDSYTRNDRWTLVDAATIDAWADAQNPKIGETVDDRWHRSFIGFDFDQLPDENCYKKRNEVWDDYHQNLLSWDYTYAPYSDLPEQNVIYAWDGQNVTTISGSYIKVNGKEIPYLIADQNAYCGKVIGINNTDGLNDYDKFAEYSTTGTNEASLYLNNVPYGDGTVTALNLKFIKKLVDDKYLPVDSKNLQKWVQVGGCNDGYYSDWIVSFMPATPVNGQEPSTTTIPIEPGSEGSDYTQDLYFKMVTLDEERSGRVFCEDLGVVSASDIDFNDIVFDVLIYKTEYLTRHMKSTDNVTWTVVSEEPTRETTYNGDVWLLAGGGTIPATIQIPKANISGDLKNLLSPPSETITTKIIVNTIENDEGRYGNPYRNDIAPKKINSEPLAITTVKDVKIFVTYGAEFAELTAYKGAAPHKICVPLNTKWLKERAEISKGYPRFTNYVKYKDADGNSLTDGPGATFDEEGNQIGDGDQNPDQNWTERVESTWKQTDQDYLYQLAIPYTPRTVDVDWQPDGQSDVTPGGAGSGYNSNNDPVLIRRRH